MARSSGAGAWAVRFLTLLGALRAAQGMASDAAKLVAEVPLHVMGSLILDEVASPSIPRKPQGHGLRLRAANPRVKVLVYAPCEGLERPPDAARRTQSRAWHVVRCCHARCRGKPSPSDML